VVEFRISYSAFHKLLSPLPLPVRRSALCRSAFYQCPVFSDTRWCAAPRDPHNPRPIATFLLWSIIFSAGVHRRCCTLQNAEFAHVYFAELSVWNVLLSIVNREPNHTIYGSGSQPYTHTSENTADIQSCKIRGIDRTFHADIRVFIYIDKILC